MSRPHRMPRSQLAALATAAAVGAAVIAAPGLGHVSTATTSLHSYWACSTATAQRAEAITIVFTGSATASRTLNHLVYHTNWTTVPASTRHFWVHGVCRSQNAQRASSTGSPRYHVQLRVQVTSNGSADPDATWGTITVANPHRETLAACGHVVTAASNGTPSGYDRGRNEVRLKLEGTPGHSVGYTYPGTSRNLLQCNGTTAGTDGKVYYISIPNSSHA